MLNADITLTLEKPFKAALRAAFLFKPFRFLFPPQLPGQAR